MENSDAVMSNILYFVVFISILIFSEHSWSQSIYSDIEPILVDTVILRPGFFRWDENTVITTVNFPPANIVRYQQILGHSNTNFAENPGSLILLSIDSVQTEPTSQFISMIEISPDTIHVTTSSEQVMEKALSRLHRMKINAEKASPDYGLIFLRCGEYRTMNF